MVGIYEVFQNGGKVGTVQVEQRGLYYHFECRCRIYSREIQRLWMRRGRRETDLGVCVPVAEGFGTEKRLAIKDCGAGEPEFFLRPQQIRKIFIPLSPEEPFRYLHRLEHAYLEQRGNTLGIVLTEKP